MLRFNEFRSTSIQEAYRDTINIDIRTYYVYFIVYPSPTNPKQPNLYIGVKHLDERSKQKHYAKDFFGGIRSSGSGNFFTDESGSTFEGFLIGYNRDKNELLGHNKNSWNANKKLLYMSSCSDTQPEALKHAYAKGIHDDDLSYHPLIANSHTFSFAQEKYNSKEEGSIANYFQEKVDKFIKMFDRKKKKDDDDKKEEVVKEDVSTSRGIFYLPIGLGGRNETKKHLSHAKSSNYGYRVYVCDDMEKYVEKLDEIIASEESIGTLDLGSDEEGKESGVKGERKNYKQNEDRVFDVAARAHMIRHYDTLSLFDWFEFKTPEEYVEFMKKQIKENKNPLLSQIPERTMFAMQRKLKAGPNAKEGFGQLYQNAGGEYLPKESNVIAKFCFGTNLTKEQTEDGLRAFDSMPGESHPENRKSFDKRRNKRKAEEIRKGKEETRKKNAGSKTYTLNNLHNGFKKIVTNADFGINHKPAIQNFMTVSNDPPTKREQGIISKDKSIKTYFWNDENNLLKKAYENKDSKAIQEMKRIFLNFDLRLMVPETGAAGYKNKKLTDLVMPLTIKNSSYFVVKQNGKLVEMQGEIVKQKGSWAKVKRNVLFNLYDFLKLIGYKNITEDQKLIEFVQSNKLIKESFDIIQEFAGVSDRLKRSNEKTKKKSEEAPKKETKTSGFRKSSQPAKADLLAIKFIESLFTKSQPYKAIFFDSGNGEQRVDIKKARELLAAPVKKLIKDK